MALTDMSDVSQLIILQKIGADKKVGTPTSVHVHDVDASGNVRRASGATVPSDGDAGFTAGCLFHYTAGGIGTTLYINEGSATSADFNAVTSGATGTVSTWDDLYTNDKLLNINGATLTFALTHATNDGFTLTGDASSAGSVVQITNAGTGKDINGTSSTWSVSKAGAFTLTSIAGSASNTAITIDANGSGKVTIAGTSTGNIELKSNVTMPANKTVVMTGVGGSDVFTVTAGDMVLSDSSLTITDADNAATFALTNNTITSGDLFTITSTSLTTGNGILFTANGVTSGIMLSLVTTASGFTTGSYIAINDGSERFSVKNDGAVVITTGVAATVAITATGIQTSAALLSFTNTGVYTGTGLVTLTANSATTGSLIVVTANGLTTGSGMLITSSGTMTTTGNLLTLTANSATTAAGILRVNANGLTTGAAVVISSSGVIATSGRLVTLTATGLTTGIALDLGTLVALTTGVGINIAHTTSVIADGGSLVRLSSSSVDTGGATNGTLLDIGNTGSTAGTLVKITDTTLLTGNAFGILHSTGVLASGASLMRLTSSSVDVGTTTGTMLDIAASAATTANLCVFTSATLTTGKGILMTLNGLTSGSGISIVSSSADTTARGLIQLTSSSTSATGASAIRTTMALLSTHFRKIMTDSGAGISLWYGDGTTGQGNLSGTAGDILFNGGTNKPEYCTGTTNWTALV